MYLLMYILTGNQNKTQVEHVVCNEAAVKRFSWIFCSDGLNKVLEQEPMVVGSINSLFRNEKQEIALIVVEGKEPLQKLANKLRKSFNNTTSLMAIPLMMV